MRKIIILVCTLCLICFSCFITYKSINYNKIKSIRDSLVYIESISNNYITSGSGFVYKTDKSKNYIVTNYHVISGSYSIYVYNKDKKKIKATIINYDEDNDIAILSIDSKLNLKSANIVTGSNLKTNDKVFVVGNPESIKNFGTINSGRIIGTKELNYLDIDFDAIKVSAKTNFGNSGGPLLDINSQVIGMMFLMDKEDNSISYAIPIDFIIDTINNLENRVSLGAVMANTTNHEILNKYSVDIVDIDGVVILEVNKDSILEKHSIEKGDIITAINKKSIKNIKELRDELYKYQKNDILEIEYYRNKSYYKISIQL